MTTTTNLAAQSLTAKILANRATTGGTMNERQKRLDRIERRKNADVLSPPPAEPTATDRLIAQALDYSAAADKNRHDEAMEAAHTEGLQATIKALAIVAQVSEADAHEMFMAALPD